MPGGRHLPKRETLWKAVLASGLLTVLTANAQSSDRYLLTTLAGSGISGDADGVATAAQFHKPRYLAMDVSGNIYVSDLYNEKVRKVTSSGVVTTLAGQAEELGMLSGVAADGSGNIFFVDSNRIKKITPVGYVSTLAGGGHWSDSPDGDGTNSAAWFHGASGVAVDGSGNIFVAEDTRIRKVTPSGRVTTLAGSIPVEDGDLGGEAGSADGVGSAARFNFPHDLAVDASGNIYVADTRNHTIRKITPGGVVTTLAGSAGVEGNADGVGAAARFFLPSGIAVDSSGNIYVTDGNTAIRKITPGGVVTTVTRKYDVLGIVVVWSPTIAAVDIVIGKDGSIYFTSPYEDIIQKLTPVETGDARTLSSISISGVSSVPSGGTEDYICTATYSDGSTAGVMPDDWAISIGPDYATISSAGVLTAKTVTSSTKVTVKALYTENGKTKTATKTVTIQPITLVSIAIKGSDKVSSGGSENYTCEATYSDGSTAVVMPVWSLSSTTYATISPSGTLTAKTVTEEKSVTVKASYKEGKVTKTDSMPVRILPSDPSDPPPPVRTLVSIAIDGPDTVFSGGSAIYTCEATYSDGSTAVVTPVWSLSSMAYATISALGRLTAKTVTSEKSVTVKASYTEGKVTKTASKPVTIKPIPPLPPVRTLVSIAISGPSTVRSGGTAAYTCTATYSDGSMTAVTPVWSLSPTEYAMIAGTGVLTASTVSSSETVTVQASYTEGETTQTATKPVAILPEGNLYDSCLGEPMEDEELTVIGSYDGFLYEEHDDFWAAPGAVHGTLSVKVSKLTGALTAKAVLQKAAVSFSAKAWSGTDGDGTRRVTVSAKSGETLDLYVRQNRIWGSLSGGKVEGALLFDGARNRFADKKDTEAQTVLTHYTGYYTVVLDGDFTDAEDEAGELNAVPRGYGYLTVTVGSGGSAKIAGILADGTKVSHASRAIFFNGVDVHVPFFVPLYSKTGWIGGLFRINRETRQVNPGGCAEEGRMMWVKPGKGPDGFAKTLHAYGGWYSKKPALQAGYQIEYALDDVPYSTGGEEFAEITYAPETLDVDVSGLKMSLPKGAAPKKQGNREEGFWYGYDGVNPSMATLSFTAGTGLFKGSFKVYYDYGDARGNLQHKAVSVPYAGVALQDGSGTVAGGAGHCLVPDNDPAVKAYKFKRSFPVSIGN
jgi:hypothetical protein